MNILIRFAGIFLALTGLLVPATGLAAEAQLENAIQQGKELFTQSSFGGNGRACQSCHLGGGMQHGQLPNGKAIPSLSNAAAIFPRYNTRVNKVITLEDQIRSCVANAIEGTPPEYGSDEMNALVSYLTSLAQGKKIDMGGAPQ